MNEWHDKRGEAGTFSSNEDRKSAPKAAPDKSMKPADVPAGNPLGSGEHDKVEKSPRRPER